MESVNEYTIVGSGFAAKYPEGGGNFSVPLQYVLGLRRMQRRFLWLEVMESTGDPEHDCRNARTFRERLASFDLANDFCLIAVKAGEDPLATGRFFGRTRRQIHDLLAGPTVLLNLSYSIRPPLLDRFTHRKLCSLDPTEVCFWMQHMEMGQSHHEEFWTIGLNTRGPGSRVPETGLAWRTYFPLVDTSLLQTVPRPIRNRFTTIGQWYWDGNIELDGEWRDFSKRAAFEKFLPLPARQPHAEFELAMNLKPDDPERQRIGSAGWRHADPHIIARTPRRYYDYLAGSCAEFSAVKLESYMNSGWLSDRSAAYLAMGRPVITEPTGADAYLPGESGLFFVRSLDEAVDAVAAVLGNWETHSRAARACAVECFDAVANLQRILGITS